MNLGKSVNNCERIETAKKYQFCLLSSTYSMKKMHLILYGNILNRPDLKIFSSGLICSSFLLQSIKELKLVMGSSLAFLWTSII